jgi:hypothetical protein
MGITTADTAVLSWRTFIVHVRWCAVALLLVAAGAADCARADPGAVFNYDIRYGPFRVMTMRLTVHVEDDRYQASSDGRTVGVVGTLFPWSAASSSSGVRSGGVMRPLRFRSAGEYRGQRRSADVDYDAVGGVRARSDPPAEADDRDPVPLALQQSTVDPLTAGLTAVLSGCQGRLNVFDGRRRYDLLLSDLGEADAPTAGDAFYSGRARHCRATIEPRGGFWRSQPSTERPSQIDGWIASPRPGLPPAPVYLELTAARGTLTISLAGIEPLPASGSSGSGE